MKLPNRLMDYVFKGLMLFTVVIYSVALIAYILFGK